MRFISCLSLSLLLVAPLAAATPHLVKGINSVAQPESSSPHAFIFAGPETVQGTELWSSDGTVQGTGVLANLNP